MASSFASQIPVVIHVIQSLKPKSVLDVGKGFGKYGMLIHEYLGVSSERAPLPDKKLREQSGVRIKAIDINLDYNFPHLEQFYESVDNVNILDRFSQYSGFDLVLMCDIIEHLPKPQAVKILEHFLKGCSRVLVATPNAFFDQDLYNSAAEHHVSFWQPSDFQMLGCHVDWQRVDCGTVYLLSLDLVDIQGFGHGPMKRLRRLARRLLDELNGG